MNQLTLDKKEKYLLACSYGPDSMALFHLLVTQGYDFECAIVNYHLRKESDLEMNGLIEYAAKFNIKVHVLDVNHRIEGNIEAECRKIRYNYFYDLTRHYKYYATLVAHHQDDLIETYLLQKDRQNCPIYYGIKENTVIRNVRIIRPLLSFSKQKLLDICHANNVPYSIDKTNFDLTIKRNEIRFNYVSNLSDAERANVIKEINVKNKELSALLNRLDQLKLDSVKVVLSLSEIEQRYALNKLLQNCGVDTRLSKENVGQVINILNSTKPNGKFHIKNDIYLIKEYDHFFFVDDRVYAPVKQYSFKLEKPSTMDNEYIYLDFTGDTSDRNVYLSDYPLTIRPVKKSDKFLINNYEVDANRLMIDWKVPYRLRQLWPVIENKDGKPIYIPRYQEEFVPDKNCNFFVKPLK